MFWVFVATILVGSLGAVHYLIVHVWMGRPFQEIPPPVVREGRLDGDPEGAAADPASEDPS